MSESLKLLDVVTLLEDLPDRNLNRGMKGTVVEILNPEVFEVEFTDTRGKTIASLGLKSSQLRSEEESGSANPAELSTGELVSFNSQEGEIISTAQIGDRWSVKLSVQGIGTKTLLCPPTEFRRLDTPITRLKRFDFDSPTEFDLLTEATRLSLAYEYDRLVSLSNSRTKLEPYQVAAVHKVLSGWEQRVLVADDVGLGKTIEAGMIIKELKARHRADRILIITPAGLVPQWRREMRDKFDERFEVLRSEDLREWRNTRPAGEPLSARYPHAIVSIDAAKPRENESNAPDFTESHWDAVIIDEAHKVAQHGQGRELTDRYKLARDIAPSSDGLLLLSATPHDGDPEAFYSLLGLLDPLRFSSADAVTPEGLDPIMVRRSKNDIRKDDGTPLFPPRWVDTTKVEFTRSELGLYNEVTDYVREGYRAATALKENAVGFLMVLLQKRMVSSIAAIRCSLQRRLLALEHPEAAVMSPSELRELKDREQDESSLPDARRQELQQKLESARLKLTTRQHQEEIKRVRNLLGLANNIKVDSKAGELVKFLEGVFAKAPEEKVLIFTEYKDTLDYLKNEVLKGFGPLAEIHGGMEMEERVRQEEYFKKPEVRLMVATDAAGEGLNLQFCHLMINYELPWNPNRIEQRIGRLHRYGQEHDVRVYNLQVLNTREGVILERLINKIKTIEKQLGGYAPNILGMSSSSDGSDFDKLSDLIVSAIADDTPPQVTAKHIEQVIESRRQMYDRLENDLFMPLHRFDKGKADALIARSREMTPSGADIEKFVRRYFELHRGKVENTRHKGVVRLRPPRHLADSKSVLDEYPAATFDRETAFKYKASDVQFIAFGHPLLDAIIQDCRSRIPRLRGAVTVKPVDQAVLNSPAGVLFNFTLRYSDPQDKTLAEELLPLLVTQDGDVDAERGKQFLGLNGTSFPDPRHNPQVMKIVRSWETLDTLAQGAAAKIAEENFARIRKRLEHQAQASRYSLDRFREAKANRLKRALEDYDQRQNAGEDMEIAIRRAKHELDQLEADVERREKEIDARRQVQANAPALLNIALLIAT
jgi:superfamily II DNA/RNA helicase